MSNRVFSLTQNGEGGTTVGIARVTGAGGVKQISGILLSSRWAAGSGGSGHRLFHWCPGCEEIHGVEVDNRNKPCWSWNENVDKPTYGPSVLHFTTDPETRQRETLCHYFVNDGMIAFCGDCPHKLAGHTVAIPPLPPEWQRLDMPG
jgi:hypothetical protein